MHVLILGSLGGELGKAARIATARGAKLQQVDDERSALARLRADAKVDLVLVELPYDVGSLVRAMSVERILAPVVACGTDAEAPSALQAIREGAREFLPLPPDPELIAAILEAASGETHALIARDPVMLETVRRAEQVAPSEASILITGESGTGKEVIARHIHRRSRRLNGPFVALNCAAIPENLLESELFGHEKGAFTGAQSRSTGRFEQAEGGTLFLDEIGDMPMEAQTRLLRVLQQGEYTTVGGRTPIRTDASPTQPARSSALIAGVAMSASWKIPSIAPFSWRAATPSAPKWSRRRAPRLGPPTKSMAASPVLLVRPWKELNVTLSLRRSDIRSATGPTRP